MFPNGLHSFAHIISAFVVFVQMYSQQTHEVSVWSCGSQCSCYTDTFWLTPTPKLNLSLKQPWQWTNSFQKLLCWAMAILLFDGTKRNFRPNPCCCYRTWKLRISPVEGGCWASAANPVRATTVMKGLEHSSLEQKLRIWTVQPGEERAQQDPINAFNYLMGREQREHSQALLHGTQGQDQRLGHRLKHRKICLNIIKILLS